MSTNEISAGERRELRSVVRGQYKVLRAEVKRRKEELVAEVEAEFLRVYREQDQAMAEAARERARAYHDFLLELQRIADDLKARRPELSVEVREGYQGANIAAGDPNRAQAHRAAISAIPDKIGDANLTLDRQENQLMRELSCGAIESEQANRFLESIPTIGELVPRVRLKEIESSLGGDS